MKRRKTYIVRFREHTRHYRVSAAHSNQANIIADKLAAQNGWSVLSCCEGVWAGYGLT